jgi:glycosyltransferase involved in cell wall biosynthesis
LRWRVAARVGRALVGSRLRELETRVSDGHAALEARLADVSARLGADARAVADAGAGLARLGENLEVRLVALEAELGRLRRETATLRGIATLHSESVRWLAERHPAGAGVSPATTTLVSVVMPVWNRAAAVGAAIESVLAQTYPHWELLVVDDGSTDGTAAVVGRYAGDPRVRLFVQPRAGCGAARNRALEATRGAIVAYLDSDNVWEPGYLAAVVDALERHPERDAVACAQLVLDRRAGAHWVRAEAFDSEVLQERNLIDLNVFAHRRTLFERLGGFDASLRRLGDWDLIRRYAVAGAPLVLPAVGGRYVDGHADQISSRESHAFARYLVRAKGPTPLTHPLRVLWALWHYPQLSESYVRTEIDRMRRWGVEVAIWAEEPPAAPFESEVPVQRGPLDEAIAQSAPHVVHTHWLHTALGYRDVVAAAGLPLTVRGHGFEFSSELALRLERDPVIRGVYLFPHFAEALPGGLGKVRPMTSCFDAERYRPAGGKDPRLVVRCSAGLSTKDLETFLQAAARCPGHRFVLAVTRCARAERIADEISARNAALGRPAEVRIDVQHDELAALVGAAGIYLHTHGLHQPYGMPASIVEAMATGCWLLARRCAAAEGYVGEAGCLYDDVDEAVALVQATTRWSDEDWERARLTSVERAFRNFTDADVLRPLLQDWLALAAERGRDAQAPAP